MLLVSGVAALLLHLDATYGNQYQAWIDDTAPSDWRGIVQVASWIALGVSVGAYFVLRNGLKDHGLRRQFGILWDVASFWPRSFHPFAPPSYAVRAVPELQARVTEVTTAAAVRDDPSAAGSSAGAAIVSGHSQGSVLSLATVASLRDDIRPRVRLVTHGSPLGGLYRRFFPRYFPNTLLTYCAAALGPTDDIADGGWLNFWRRTDPIGDAVCDAQDRDRPAGHPPEAVVAALETSPTGATQLPDVRLADPLARTNDFELEPAPRGHSGYMADAAMWRTIDAIAADLDAALANSEFVVMIDDRDCATGVAERTEAHRSGEGMHRAVSVFVFNEEGRLLIQRRSAGKALFAGRWANTCCTHPRPGESAADAAARCLQSELGIRATLEEVGAFAYEAVDPEGGGEERERTRVFVGQTRALPSPNPDEVEQIAWVPMDELQRTMADHPDDYAPWLIEAFTAIPDLAARTEASSPPRPE
jgi:isopentenyl-diphosphate delta-isomerase